MPDRTHLAQPDEALRQARRDQRTRAGLRWIADRLASFRPTDPMTDNARDAAVTRYVTDTHHGDTAIEVRGDLLRALPAILRDDSRDAYATRVRLIIEGATA